MWEWLCIDFVSVTNHPNCSQQKVVLLNKKFCCQDVKEMSTSFSCVCFWWLFVYWFVVVVWFVLVGSFNLVKCANGLFLKEDFIAVKGN